MLINVQVVGPMMKCEDVIAGHLKQEQHPMMIYLYSFSSNNDLI